ncbi:hypothetical protein RCH08_002830 [Janthinobacterium sp. CG_S6]|nr:hypothetical protein [Janthinobacterium sp. CG_S6]
MFWIILGGIAVTGLAVYLIAELKNDMEGC